MRFSMCFPPSVYDYIDYHHNDYYHVTRACYTNIIIIWLSCDPEHMHISYSRWTIVLQSAICGSIMHTANFESY